MEIRNLREILLIVGEKLGYFSNFFCKIVMSKGIGNMLYFIIYYCLFKYSYEKKYVIVFFYICIYFIFIICYGKFRYFCRLK